MSIRHSYVKTLALLGHRRMMKNIVSVWYSRTFNMQRRNPYTPKGNCLNFSIYRKCPQMKTKKLYWFFSDIYVYLQNFSHKLVYLSSLSLNSYLEIIHTIPFAGCVFYNLSKGYIFYFFGGMQERINSVIAVNLIFLKLDIQEREKQAYYFTLKNRHDLRWLIIKLKDSSLHVH